MTIDDLDGLDMSDVSSGGALPSVTPGDILREQFMIPPGLSARALARHLEGPASRVTAIICGRCAVTAETALRLAARFRTRAARMLPPGAARMLPPGAARMLPPGAASTAALSPKSSAA